jgi:hypothetical protein
MNSTKSRGEVSPQKIRTGATRPWIAALGGALCLGLWACGGGATGHEETASSKVPAAPAEAASAAPAEVPSPAPAPAPAPAQGSDFHKERGTSREGHLVLTGDYKYDEDAVVTCASFPNGTLQISLGLHDSPIIVLVLDKVHGSGDYDAESRLRATYTGEGIRQSRGPAKAKLRIAPPTEGEPRSGISGSFEGKVAGEAGTTTVTGTFENCFYELPAPKG